MKVLIMFWDLMSISGMIPGCYSGWIELGSNRKELVTVISFMKRSSWGDSRDHCLWTIPKAESLWTRERDWQGLHPELVGITPGTGWDYTWERDWDYTGTETGWDYTQD